MLSTTYITYDKHGNVVGAERNGENNSVSAKITRNGFGDIKRSQEPDDTITRYVYNPFGDLEKTYRGISDKHEFW